MAAWAFSLWLLVKRLFLSIVLNVLDGSANAILALVVQFVDTILLLYSRPYINRQTEVAESIGAVTNLLVMFCLSFLIRRAQACVDSHAICFQSYVAVSVPVIAGVDVDMPPWLGDFSSMLLATFATALSCFFALQSPIAYLFKLLFKLASFLAPMIGCRCVGGIPSVCKHTHARARAHTHTHTHSGQPTNWLSQLLTVDSATHVYIA